MKKKMASQQIPTLQEYVIVSQDKREVTVFRRADGWASETLSDLESVLKLSSIAQSLSLREIYETIF